MKKSIRKPALVCPAGSLPALKIAVDNGADSVYTGFKNDTNARNFAGLNFSEQALADGIAYARAKGCSTLIAINTFPQQGRVEEWRRAVDRSAELGARAVILADMGLLAYARDRHPNLALHLSVQGSATNYEAINFCQREFGIRRVVLPRVLTLAQVEHLIQNTEAEIEVFGFGSLCVMNEGRCWLSSYATGESPNTVGVCSPAKFVRWERRNARADEVAGEHMEARLNGVLIDAFAPQESAGYPTLCKGRFEVQGDTYYALEEPTSLNTLEILPRLIQIGVSALKIEGRQRSPAYVGQVTRALRAALDRAAEAVAANEAEAYQAAPAWQHELSRVAEGRQATLGAYSRPWR
ncbi:MAG: U32 family peptidase [Zoogloeaceae bacterium]|jgi:putative protease|nr:U32 family peptidase [Zoogloeaceae bacterium]